METAPKMAPGVKTFGTFAFLPPAKKHSGPYSTILKGFEGKVYVIPASNLYWALYASKRRQSGAENGAGSGIFCIFAKILF